MPSVQAPARMWLVPVPVSVTTLPDVPVTLHFPKVWVVVPRAMVWATVLVEASSVNWLLPPMLNVDVPVAPPMVSLLKEKLLPSKVLAVVVVLDKRMSAVPLYKAKEPPALPMFQTVPVDVRVHVPEPIFSVAVPPAVNLPAVTL